MRLLAVLLLAALLPACATITSGTTQNISVITDPPGATCQLLRDGGVLAIVNPTPGTVSVSKSSRDIAVNCTRPGRLSGVQNISPSIQAMTAGNLLIGGVIGLAVDAASGALSQYPPMITVILPPEQFASVADREAFFASRSVEVRRLYTERIEAERRNCPTVGADVCNPRIAALQAELDAELMRLNLQRQVAPVI